MNKKPFFFLKKDFSYKKLNQINRADINLIPIVDDNLKIFEIINSKELKLDFLTNLSKNKVVIMSGGYGKRMQPFTKVLPKALLPIGDKTLIQFIIDKFIKNNFFDFTICLNFKNNLITNYLKSLNYFIDLKYIIETKELGTIGALSLIKPDNLKPIIVINCDTYINYDYKRIIRFHEKSNSDLTLVVSKLSHTIEYGVCEVDKYQKLVEFKEKPSLEFLANVGFYIIDQKLIKYIPKNQKYDFNIFLKKIINLKKYKVSTYQINKERHLDFGIWGNYEKSINSIIK